MGRKTEPPCESWSPWTSTGTISGQPRLALSFGGFLPGLCLRYPDHLGGGSPPCPPLSPCRTAETGTILASLSGTQTRRNSSTNLPPQREVRKMPLLSQMGAVSWMVTLDAPLKRKSKVAGFLFGFPQERRNPHTHESIDMADKCHQRDRPEAKMTFFRSAHLPLASSRGKIKRTGTKGRERQCQRAAPSWQSSQDVREPVRDFHLVGMTHSTAGLALGLSPPWWSTSRPPYVSGWSRDTVRWRL